VGSVRLTPFSARCSYTTTPSTHLILHIAIALVLIYIYPTGHTYATTCVVIRVCLTSVSTPFRLRLLEPVCSRVLVCVSLEPVCSRVLHCVSLSPCAPRSHLRLIEPVCSRVLVCDSLSPCAPRSHLRLIESVCSCVLHCVSFLLLPTHNSLPLTCFIAFISPFLLRILDQALSRRVGLHRVTIVFSSFLPSRAVSPSIHSIRLIPTHLTTSCPQSSSLSLRERLHSHSY